MSQPPSRGNNPSGRLRHHEDPGDFADSPAFRCKPTCLPGAPTCLPGAAEHPSLSIVDLLCSIVVLRRTFGIEVLECSRCHATMLAIAAITQREVVDRIPSHLRLPLGPEPTVDGSSVRYQVTSEPIPD